MLRHGGAFFMGGKEFQDVPGKGQLRQAGAGKVGRARGDREGPWAECSLCGGEIGWGQRYYRVGGENVCRQCLADFAAQILAAYEVRGGEDV